jgi:hypothetical protein
MMPTANSELARVCCKECSKEFNKPGFLEEVLFVDFMLKAEVVTQPSYPFQLANFHAVYLPRRRTLTTSNLNSPQNPNPPSNMAD